MKEMDLSSQFNQELVAYAFKLVAKQKDTKTVVQKILNKVGKEYRLSGIYVKETQGEEIRLKYVYTWGSIGIEKLPGKEYPVKEKVWKYITRQFHKKGILVNDTSVTNDISEAMRKFVEKNGIKSLIQCPLYNESEVIGCIDFVDVKKRKWKTEELETLRILSQIVTCYLFKLRAYEEAKEQIQILSETDSKTGLYKYDCFIERIDRVIKYNKFVFEANPGRLDMDLFKKGIVVYTDFGDFSKVNEVYGFQKGNELLLDFANHLRGLNVEKSIGCRLYSDHFIVYLEVDSKDTQEECMKFLEECNRMFLASENEKFEKVKLTLHTGVYFVNAFTDGAEQVVACSNTARKKAKEKKQNACEKYFT